MNSVRASFASYWQSIQHALFPQLEHVLGPLTGKQQQLVQTLEVIRIEHLIPRYCRMPGRPPKDRAAMARAFVAKAVYDRAHSRFPGHALTPTGVMAIRCKQFHLPDL